MKHNQIMKPIFIASASLLLLFSACSKNTDKNPAYSGQLDSRESFFYNQLETKSELMFVNTADNTDSLRFDIKIEANFNSEECQILSDDGNCYYVLNDNFQLKSDSILTFSNVEDNGELLEIKVPFVINGQFFETNNKDGEENLEANTLTLTSTIYNLFAKVNYPTFDTIQIADVYDYSRLSNTSYQITLNQEEEINAPHFVDFTYDKDLGILNFTLKYPQNKNGVLSTISNTYRNASIVN